MLMRKKTKQTCTDHSALYTQHILVWRDFVIH